MMRRTLLVLVALLLVSAVAADAAPSCKASDPTLSDDGRASWTLSKAGGHPLNSLDYAEYEIWFRSSDEKWFSLYYSGKRYHYLGQYVWVYPPLGVTEIMVRVRGVTERPNGRRHVQKWQVVTGSAE